MCESSGDSGRSGNNQIPECLILKGGRQQILFPHFRALFVFQQIFTKSRAGYN